MVLPLLHAAYVIVTPGLNGKCVSLDALHTQRQTAAELTLEHGADYLFTVKGNQSNLLAQVEHLVSDPASEEAAELH